MLVLSRKVGEKIFIGEKISVTIVRVAQGIVRIGIEAPDDLPILREELKDQHTPAARCRNRGSRAGWQTGSPAG